MSAFQILTFATQQALDTAANVLSGATMTFTLTGTSTPTNAYADKDLTTPLANPLSADAAGNFVSVFLDPLIVYRVVLKTAAGVVLKTWDPANENVIGYFTQAVLGALLYPRTAAEISASVTPVNYAYAPGHAQRFAVLDGITDDTTALTNWAKVTGHHFYPALTGKITGAIALVSNSTYEFAQGALITTATHDISILSADSMTNIVISGGHVKYTSVGNAPYVAGVRLSSCSYCTVDGMEFEGMQWAGVYLDDSTQCIVKRNYIHDTLMNAGTDIGDIIVYRSASFNTVEGNRCFGGLNADHGIFCQGPGGVGTPAYNKVSNNWVGDHRSYGIVFYIGVGQGNNECIGNTVQNITGTGIAGASGSGIYCVGNGIGTMQIIGNMIRNCCSLTTLATNGPGGISVNDTLTAGSRVIVQGNTVEEMAQGSGILISTVHSGAVVSGNTVRIPSSNNGAGPGGATLQGDAIRVIASDNTSVTGNLVLNQGGGDACFSFASGVSVDRIVISDNVFRASTGSALHVDRTAAFLHTDCAFSNNALRSDAAANMITMVGADRCTVTGNTGNSNTSAAYSFSSCTGLRVANNSGFTNSATGVVTSGTCTGSYYDKTNNVTGTINNGGTGFKTEFFAAAVPAAGTAAVGDAAEQSVPVVGNPKRWRCTVAGTPGTWVSEGNL